MRVLVLSDTHEDKMNALPRIIATVNKVDVIFHCGDINPEHVNSKLFGGLPVVCALTEEQVEIGKNFPLPPQNWIFTRPGKRVILVGDFNIYLGHKRSFEILTGSEAVLKKTLRELRRQHDNLKYFFSGHTHHQILMTDGNTTFVNPGAVENSLGIAGGAEYAILDTDTGCIDYKRIPFTQSIKNPLKVAIISDSFDISEMDPLFWKKLAERLKKERVTHIIHCGNIALGDIGNSELDQFEVHYNLRPDQIHDGPKKTNWHCISHDMPVVEINGYQFCAKLSFGLEILGQSEIDMQMACFKIQGQSPEVKIIVGGLSHGAFLEELETAFVIDPGDIVHGRRYAIFSGPDYSFTFGKVPYDPLPPLAL